jgi:hypothetical protein
MAGTEELVEMFAAEVHMARRGVDREGRRWFAPVLAPEIVQNYLADNGFDI